MTQMIFVNLPVADLARFRAFYKASGFTNNAGRGRRPDRQP